MLMAIILCTGFVFADEYEAEYPKIIFENKLDITKVKAGDNFEVNIVVKNVGNQAAKYVNIANSIKYNHDNPKPGTKFKLNHGL